ncbi:NADPH-dependent glutamate synthase beta chain [Longilinea arvoryzae]|uniref:ferredoxin--NADP(+) reductase n=1 Tax=Longilinea arvoryzae TaxID=360412 RepID=A0A0S7BNH9_9CHLR|nr:FAD-dependent oxidoreductase [Longilinea arvoryzae]GAP15413.1 NADPH-dependent glutamate synthase beta chain [Longilinea arvoryzae]
MQPNKHLVAIVGAGPAGLFAARELAVQGVDVILFNRDIKPGGLAEYGIYPDKHKMKEGLRTQFRQILSLPNVHYFGNVLIGSQADFSLDDLRKMGFQAILVTVGAQGTKWLGLPGEDLTGVYHAKDLVYHYNRLPPYSTQEFEIGKRVAIIGAGNVSMDITRFLATSRMVDEVISVVRRGPAEVKFDIKELEHVVAYIDLSDLYNELERVRPVMVSVGQNPVDFHDFVMTALEKGDLNTSRTKLHMRFLASPTRILGDENRHVCGLEIEENTLVNLNGDSKARGLGKYSVLDVDTVIFAIGDQVDGSLGIPVKGSEFIKNPAPRYPVEEQSYELIDPDTGEPIQDIFVAGWSRKASTGLVGIARKDGTNGARIVLQYLTDLPETGPNKLIEIEERIQALQKPVVTWHELQQLQAAEQARALELQVEEFKYSTNEEMLQAIGIAEIH